MNDYFARFVIVCSAELVTGFLPLVYDKNIIDYLSNKKITIMNLEKREYELARSGYRVPWRAFGSWQRAEDFESSINNTEWLVK